MELESEHSGAPKESGNSDAASYGQQSSNLLSELLQRSCPKTEKDSDFFKQEHPFKSDQFKSDPFKQENLEHPFKAGPFKSDQFKDNPPFKEEPKEFKSELREGEFSSTNDNRDDRPDNPFDADSRPNRPDEEASSRSKQSNQMMETDPSESSAMNEAGKLTNSAAKNLLMNELIRCKESPAYKIEDDFYAELPANTPLQELVRCALAKQGYSVEDCSAAKGEF